MIIVPIFIMKSNYYQWLFIMIIIIFTIIIVVLRSIINYSSGIVDIFACNISWIGEDMLNGLSYVTEVRFICWFLSWVLDIFLQRYSQQPLWITSSMQLRVTYEKNATRAIRKEAYLPPWTSLIIWIWTQEFAISKGALVKRPSSKVISESDQRFQQKQPRCNLQTKWRRLTKVWQIEVAQILSLLDGGTPLSFDWLIKRLIYKQIGNCWRRVP